IFAVGLDRVGRACTHLARTAGTVEIEERALLAIEAEAGMAPSRLKALLSRSSRVGIVEHVLPPGLGRSLPGCGVGFPDGMELVVPVALHAQARQQHGEPKRARW